METNLGNILFEAGRQDEGLRHLDLAIRIAPRLPRPWYDRATMRLRRGDRAGAMSDYTEAIRLDPAYADAYVGRATVLHANGDGPGALNDLARALEVAPPDWPRRAEVDGLLRKSRAPGS
jgi:tetratricopeptide (TPR) repeat protein